MKRKQNSYVNRPKSAKKIDDRRTIQCTAIAISTGVQCKKNVTDSYQLSQKFPKCSIHSEACKNIYPKYKAACAIPVNIIPDNPRNLTGFTVSELQDAVRDAKECALLRRQYTSECFAGNTDEGHSEIIENVSRKARMIDIEIKRRKEDELRKQSGDRRGGERELFSFRRGRSPSPLFSTVRRSPSPRKQQQR